MLGVHGLCCSYIGVIWDGLQGWGCMVDKVVSVSVISGVLKLSVPVAVGLGHQRPLLQPFWGHLGQPPRPRSAMLTRLSVWVLFPVFCGVLKANVLVAVILVHPWPVL